MSDKTWQALESAVAEHAVDEAENGGIVTDWVLIAAVADPVKMDQTVYVTASSSGPLHHRIGLVQYVKLRTDAQTRREGD